MAVVILRLYRYRSLMLKHLTIALLLGATALPALAQTTPASSSATGQYQYCNLVSYYTTGRDAHLEFGQHAKPAVANAELEALDVEIKKLDSSTLALNYLAGRGWEYAGVTSLAPASIIYLLRRRTQ